MPLVGQHQTSLFPSPVRSAVPVDANRVRGNDNVLATALNAHDADDTIHVQSSDLIDRPAAGTVGRLWATPYGTGEFQLWYDDGAQWCLMHHNDPYDVLQVSTSQTLTLDHVHTFVRADTSGGSVTLTLPAAATVTGYRLDIKKIASSHTLTVDGDGTETIDGSATLSWSTTNQSYSIISDGTQWWIV